MSSSLDYLQLCRLCLVKENVSLPIFEDEGDARQIYFKISACLPVKVSREDKLPKKICDECGYKVELLYQFWNTSVNAEKQLLHWLGDVGIQDKQDYVTEVLDPSILKQERSGDNRLDGNVLQVSGQGNIDINMIDNMSIITIPAVSEQEFTTVPMDTSGTVQAIAVPGPSTQATHDQSQTDVSQMVGEESDDDNYDDGCDNDDGMAVKEEADEDHEQTTFASVSLPCDEAGPSGLQQSEITAQTADGDPKTGDETFGGLSGMLRQILSPNAESEELAFNASCHVLDQQQQQQSQSIYNTHGSVLSSPLPSSALTHHHQQQQQQLVSMQDQVNYQDQVQIITETHICPNCGLKLTYHVRTAHRHQVDQILEVGETQLMRFTCHICSKTFLAQSHVKLPGEHHLQQQQQQQQMIQVTSRIQTNMISTSNQATHYQTNPQHQQQQQQRHHHQLSQQQQQQVSVMQDKNFSCEQCQATFRYRTLLDKHKKMHEMAAGQDKPYSCPRCLMRFETRNLYNHHAKTHKPIISQSERPSNASLSSGGTGKDAILYNKSNNSYPCETCAKEFPSIESLTSHKAVHRSRPLICDVCGKGFTHRKYYVVHQRIHTGERPYLCAMCGKSFTQASTLTVHRRYHTGERPYTCTLCGKGFVTRTIMLNHMKKH